MFQVQAIYYRQQSPQVTMDLVILHTFVRDIRHVFGNFIPYKYFFLNFVLFIAFIFFSEVFEAYI